MYRALLGRVTVPFVASVTLAELSGASKYEPPMLCNWTQPQVSPHPGLAKLATYLLSTIFGPLFSSDTHTLRLNIFS